jgi:hypothetical protein
LNFGGVREKEGKRKGAKPFFETRIRDPHLKIRERKREAREPKRETRRRKSRDVLCALSRHISTAAACRMQECS